MHTYSDAFYEFHGLEESIFEISLSIHTSRAMRIGIETTSRLGFIIYGHDFAREQAAPVNGNGIEIKASSKLLLKRPTRVGYR